jgi:hypothetical protein
VAVRRTARRPTADPHLDHQPVALGSAHLASRAALLPLPGPSPQAERIAARRIDLAQPGSPALPDRCGTLRDHVPG